jgi:alpha-tubulin suppressor-like RCC1 family protein
LGIGSTEDQPVPTRVLPGEIGWTHVAAGGYDERNAFACGIISGGVRCWGSDSGWQLGVADGFAEPHETPTSISTTYPGSYELVELALGDQHTCLRTIRDGSVEVYCWGANARGQLCRGTSGGLFEPSTMVNDAISGAEAIAAGASYTCLARGGEVFCCGAGGRYQLGTGSMADSASPVMAVGLPSGSVQSLALGAETSYVIVDEQLHAWGANDDGQLGAFVSGLQSSVPVHVMSLPEAPSQVAAGRHHACALVAGQVFCWGNNADHQADPSSNDLTIAGPIEVEL